MPSLEERFWAKVDIRGEDECWPWLAFRNKKGYGDFGTVGKKHEPAHRVAYRLVNGEIPEGLHVLHRCDYPPCCNPRHLFTGTNADNMADKMRKGRNVAPKGEDHPKAKLTLELAREIRSLYCVGGMTQPQLGRMFGVTSRAISDIVNYVTWKE